MELTLTPLTSISKSQLISAKRFPFDTRRQGFACVFEGSASFGNAAAPFGINVEKAFAGEEMKIRDQSGNRTLVLFGDGDEVEVQASETGVRFLLISGAPLRETSGLAWTDCDEHSRRTPRSVPRVE